MTATPAPTIAPLTYEDETTSFFPFTTAWSEPPGCSKLFMALRTTPSFALTAFMPEWGISIKGGETCLPPEFSQYTSSYGKTQHYLGPFKCPGDWTEATTRVISSSYTQTFCCPSGYGKLLNQADDARLWGTCVSSVNIYDDFTWAYQEDNAWTVTTNGSHQTTTATSGSVSYRTVIANPYVMGYNTAPLTSTTVPTTSTSSTDQSGSGLSTGAKAGIGVGVSLGVIAILAAMGLFYFLGRRRRRDPGSETTGDSDKDAGKAPEISASERSELDGKDGQALMPRELQSQGDASELQGDKTSRQELEGLSAQSPVELEASNLDQVMGRDTMRHAETRGEMDR